MLRISVPPNFRHAAEIWDNGASNDPRRPGFEETDLRIDLRDCTFIRAAAALWCAVFPLLAFGRGARVELIVPDDRGVCTYLKSLGLFDVLRSSGVDVDDRGIRAKEDPQIVVPFTRFAKQADVELIANETHERLKRLELGAYSVYPDVIEVFAELGNNAVEHADSTIGALGVVQFYRFEEGQRFVVGVADGGIGIRRSLERNPELRDRISYDWDAIELATRERVSSTGSTHRGIGLFDVAERMRKGGRSLMIHSGIGSMQIGEERETESRRSNLFPGTLAYASIPA